MSLQQPVVADVRTGTLILGSPVATWPQFAQAEPYRIAGVVINRGGDVDTVLKPPTVAHVNGPRLLSDANGVAQVVWATSRDTTAVGQRRVDALWYGTFDGREWTTPQEVMRGYNLLWDSFSPATLAVGNQLYVAVTGPDIRDSLGTQRLWIARRVNGEWQVRSPVEERGFLALQEVRLQSTGANDVIAVYTGFTYNYGAAAVRRPFVKVIRSTDAGATWSAPETIRVGPDSTSAVVAGLHRRQDQSLHLFWHAQRNGTVVSPIVYHEASTDGGRTWTRSDSLIVPGQFSVLRTSQTGDAIVLTMRLPDNTLVQGLAGANSSLKLLSEKPVRFLPTSLARANGTIETWWGEYAPVALRDSSAWGLGYTSYRTTTTVRCAAGGAGQY